MEEHRIADRSDDGLRRYGLAAERTKDLSPALYRVQTSEPQRDYGSMGYNAALRLADWLSDHHYGGVSVSEVI